MTVAFDVDGGHQTLDDRGQPARVGQQRRAQQVLDLEAVHARLHALDHFLGQHIALHDLDPFGVSIVGSSFGFRVEGAPPGNLTAVAEHVCNRPIVDNRLLEWSTQATNYSMVNMLCRQPSIRLCRTTQVLHRWTDEG